ncbi:MAG: hypothetical protein IBX72_11370 [Nitrospirae bacterium]|nr:hypothetical protein [Nitrospirota bacterium]
MEWGQAIEHCSNLLQIVHNSEIEKIRANLEIGSVVAQLLQNARYGDRAVEKFASELTKKRGKTVYPQRLYEAYEVWSTVGTIEKVFEIQKKLDDDITWNWLVKNSARGFFNEDNEDVKKEKVQRILRQIENTSEKIEQIVREKDKLDEDTKKEFEGTIIAINESVSLALNNSISQSRTIHVKESQKVPVSYISDESNEKTRMLFCYIKYDELTGTELSELEIHSLLTDGDIDTAIVVSRTTHHEIHKGVYSSDEIEKAINNRNLSLAKLFLKLYLSHRDFLCAEVKS